MPNYAEIENGLVVNIVVAEVDYAATKNWVALPEGAGMGWSYDGTSFTDNRPQIEPLPAPTKEQLMAELAALTTKINALG